MSQPVNLSNEAYQKLTFFKKKNKQRSYSTAVDELLRVYWSKQIAEIQIQEHFSEFVGWLRARNVMTERAEDALSVAQSRIFQGIAAKKERDLNTRERP